MRERGANCNREHAGGWPSAKLRTRPQEVSATPSVVSSGGFAPRKLRVAVGGSRRQRAVRRDSGGASRSCASLHDALTSAVGSFSDGTAAPRQPSGVSRRAPAARAIPRAVTGGLPGGRLLERDATDGTKTVLGVLATNGLQGVGGRFGVQREEISRDLAEISYAPVRVRLQRRRLHAGGEGGRVW